jgi:hypothetical protein
MAKLVESLLVNGLPKISELSVLPLVPSSPVANGVQGSADVAEARDVTTEVGGETQELPEVSVSEGSWPACHDSDACLINLHTLTSDNLPQMPQSCRSYETLGEVSEQTVGCQLVQNQLHLGKMISERAV